MIDLSLLWYSAITFLSPVEKYFYVIKTDYSQSYADRLYYPCCTPLPDN